KPGHHDAAGDPFGDRGGAAQRPCSGDEPAPRPDRRRYRRGRAAPAKGRASGDAAIHDARRPDQYRARHGRRGGGSPALGPGRAAAGAAAMSWATPSEREAIQISISRDGLATAIGLVALLALWEV